MAVGRARSLAVIATAAAALAGCGSSSKPAAATAAATGTRPASRGSTFYFRPVVCQIPAYSAGTPSPSASSAGPSNPCNSTSSAHIPSTADEPTAEVIRPPDPKAFGSSAAFRFVLGPADMNGSAISSAVAVVDQVTGQYSIQLKLTPDGAAELDRMARDRYRCYQQNPSDPLPCSQEAFEVDGMVESAPTFQASSFNGNVSISGQFTGAQARSLADELKRASGQSS